MKTLLTSLLFSAALFAQTTQPVQPIIPASVSGNIVVTGADGTAKTYTISLPSAAVASLAQFIAATTSVTSKNGVDVPLPQYQDIGDLIVKHLATSLIGPLVARYPPPAVQTAVQAAATAQAAVATSVAAAAAGTVTVQ